MIELNDLGKHRKGRVWFGDIPSSNKCSSKICLKVDCIKPTTIDEEIELAIELYYPRNASNYGMLGLKYTPKPKAHLEIQVDVVQEKDEKFHESLVAGYDTVFFGVHKEYSEIVLETAQKEIASCEMGFSGKMVFKFGASAEVGSSPIVFAKLTEILIGILSNKLSEKMELKNFITEKM